MEAPLSFYLVAVLVVIFVGIAKAGFGGGVGVAAVPLLLLATPGDIPVARVVALLLPVLCVCDWFALYHYLRLFEARYLWQLLPGAMVGIALGMLFMQAVSSDALKLGIGILAMLFVLDQLTRTWLLRQSSRLPANHTVGGVFGLATGFASMLAHAGGPPATIYLLPHIADRRRFVGTTVIAFTIINAAKLWPYYHLGLFDLTLLSTSALLLPAVPVGVWLGVWLNRRMNDRIFRQVILVLLFLTGLRLAFEGAWG